MFGELTNLWTRRKLEISMRFVQALARQQKQELKCICSSDFASGSLAVTQQLEKTVFCAKQKIDASMLHVQHAKHTVQPGRTVNGGIEARASPREAREPV
jgi:acyl CoA:acetate/3-ketoacid CoA transferase alpha subunit